MAPLWTSADPEHWRAALDAYPGVVAAQGVSGLAELDAWYRTRLPAILGARTPPFAEPDELQDVVRWKMKRGEWRARNLVLVNGNDPELIRRTSERAFALAPAERAPVEALSELAGVGPATASALLAAHRPDLYPFLDEVVGAGIVELGAPKFTLPYYLRYAAALRGRASAIGAPWTAQAVGMALWAAAGGKLGASAAPASLP